MRKNFVFGLLSVVVGAFWTLTGYGQLNTLTEGFDTTGNSVPTPTGIFAQSQPWINVNNSDVPNTTAFNWQQGDSGTFIWTAQSPVGSTTSFAQVSFLSTNGTILSDWLLTPVLTLEAGATFSFYTVAAKGTTFANDLQVYISTSGSSTNVGSDAQTPTGGVFTLLPGGDLNPTLAVNGYPLTQPNGLTLETFTLTSAEIGAATTGRIGLRYFIPNTATQGSGIGVDTFSFADPTVFTRTVSGSWTDTTGWTPNAVPNGTTVTAQLVNPGTGTNSVDLGGGTFTLNQLQFSGTNSGTWNVTNGTIIFDGTNPTFLNQGDSSGLVGTLPSLQLNASTTFEIDNASAITEVTGTISGTGGLTKTGSGALVLIGINTYTGGTNLNGGVLAVDNDGNLGSGALSFNGGTLEALAAGGGITSSKAVSLNAGGGTFSADAGTNSTLSGAVGGAGSFTKNGSGTLSLTGTNTYSGGTNLNGGILAVDSDGNLGTGALSFNGGTLEALAAGGGITSSKAVTLNTGGGTFLADAGTSSTLSGVIGGAGSFTKNGSGTLSLTGANTYSGGTSLNGGILAVNSDGNLGSGALSFNGGTLEALAAGGGITSSKAITLNPGGGAYSADAGTNST